MASTAGSNAERVAIMRKQPPDSPPEVTPKQLDGVITEVREYELITPLMGGGAIPKEIDEVTVVRATEIRGQLRFWWRACHAGKFGDDLAAMKQAEDTLWGAAFKKGDRVVKQKELVQIAVELLQPGNPIKPFIIERKQPKPIQGIPGYVAFPLQPDSDELKEQDPYIPNMREHVSFSLTISFPAERQKEVRAALWAWETFGGVGARTRRGFGALHLLKINSANYIGLPLSNKVEEWIREKLAASVEEGTSSVGIPYLTTKTQFTVTSSFRNVLQAWKKLIDTLHHFRQARYPGRSIWPEAETIRRLTGRRDSRYGELPHPQKFPRAAFGLPIIFHFKDSNDPKDTTLIEAGEEKDRFASPLILRPFQCRDNQAVGLALLLDGSRVDAENLVLVEKEDGASHPVRAMLTQDEARKITVLDGETDVLQAFMNYLEGDRR